MAELLLSLRVCQLEQVDTLRITRADKTTYQFLNDGHGPLLKNVSSVRRARQALSLHFSLYRRGLFLCRGFPVSQPTLTWGATPRHRLLMTRFPPPPCSMAPQMLPLLFPAVSLNASPVWTPLASADLNPPLLFSSSFVNPLSC